MIRIFLPLYCLLFVFSVFHEHLFDRFLIWMAPEAVEEDTIGDLSGAFYLIEEVLRLSPQSEWPAKLEKMQAPNIPVKLKDITSYELSPAVWQRLDNGEIVVPDAEEDLALKRLPDSRLLIQIGPVDTVESYDQSTWFTLVSGSGGMIICIVLWTLTVQRRIRHLSQVAHQFGEGDLTIRADETNSLRVSDLNQSFNSMADRIQQLIESHKHLSNAVSHELRTPISRIRFELDYAADLDDLDELRESLNSIADDVSELEELVTEALEYARYERAGLLLEYEPHELIGWLKCWHYDFRLPTPGLLFDCQLHSETLTVAFHEASVKRALDNLVLNAARYARSQIVIRQELSDQQVIIHIEDDGPGIDQALWDNLFEPFVRAEKSRSKDTGGYGLGLAIVKQIMLRHQGSVSISRSSLGGACFSLKWPTAVLPSSDKVLAIETSRNVR